jgi:hypothetical protein
VVDGWVTWRDIIGCQGSGFVMFWDWESGEIVGRVDVDAKDVSQMLCILDMGLMVSVR